MERLKLFGLIIKVIWAFAGWLASLKKKPAPEPVETALDAKDAAPVQRKPKVRVRTSKRTPKPYEPPKSLV